MPSLWAVLGLNASGFKAGLDATVSKASSAGAKIRSSLSEAITGNLAHIASIGFIEEAARRTIEYAENMSILAQRLGIGVEAAQSWDYALRMSGSSMEEARSFFEKLGSSRDKALGGNGQMIASFQRLGITLQDLKSQRVEDLGLQISRAFEIGDPQALIGPLREVGGRGAGEMVAAFRSGLSDMVSNAKEEGLVMSADTVERLRDIAEEGKKIWMEFIAGVGPLLTWLAAGIEDNWRKANMAMRGLVGFATGGFSGAKDLMTEYAEKIKESDRLAEERRKKRQEIKPAAFDERESDQAARKREQEAEKQRRLELELWDIQDKNYLNALSKEEQITELHRRRAELARFLADNWNKLTPENRLKAQIDLEKLSGEEAQHQRDLDKPGKRYSVAVNQLQAIGAFANTPGIELTALRVHERSEGHLREIKGDIKRLAGAKSGGVRF